MPADSLAKARTPEPIGKGGRNWVTKLKPGNRGELPPYIQHIRNAIMAKGVPESRATAIAVSAPKKWLRGKADKGTKAASALATSEWEKDRAQSRIGRAARAVATHAAEVPVSVRDLQAIHEAEVAAFDAIEKSLGAPVLEAALARVQWADYRPLSPREHVLDELAERAAEALTIAEATRSREPGSGRFAGYLRKVTSAPGAGPCAKCGALKLPDKMCPACEAPAAGHKVTLAEAVYDVMEERELTTKARKELPKSAFAIPEKAPGSGSYPIHDLAHARNALARSAGKPEESRVKAAVFKRFPALREQAQEAERAGAMLGALQEAHGDRVHSPETIMPGIISRKGRIGARTARHEGVDKGFEGFVHSVKVGSREKTIGATARTGGLWKARTPKGKMMTFARHPDAIKALHDVHKGKGPLLLREADAPRHHLAEDSADGDPVALKRVTGHGDFLDRVKALAPGEMARLPDGGAVKHHATEDGRAVWSAGTPSSWTPGAMNFGPARRTPEDAVSDAFRDSAGSNDPASLGGATRYRAYTSLKVGGKQHRFVGVRPHDAKPIVRDISGVMQPNSADPKVVNWSDLHPDDTIMQQGDAGGVLGGMLDQRLQERARGARDTIASIAGNGGATDTYDFHTKRGKFGKGRAMVHAGMIRHVLANPKAHGSGPVAMVATRSPGGGAVHTTKGAGGAVPHDAVHVSIAAMRERLPEHAALKAHPKADERAATDREARHVAKIAATLALMRGKSVVVHDDPSPGHDGLRSLAAGHADAMRRTARSGL